MSKHKRKTFNSFDEWRRHCFPKAYEKEQKEKRIQKHGRAGEVLRRIENKIKKRLNKERKK